MLPTACAPSTYTSTPGVSGDRWATRKCGRCLLRRCRASRTERTRRAVRPIPGTIASSESLPSQLWRRRFLAECGVLTGTGGVGRSTGGCDRVRGPSGVTWTVASSSGAGVRSMIGGAGAPGEKIEGQATGSGLCAAESIRASAAPRTASPSPPIPSASPAPKGLDRRIGGLRRDRVRAVALARLRFGQRARGVCKRRGELAELRLRRLQFEGRCCATAIWPRRPRDLGVGRLPLPLERGELRVDGDPECRRIIGAVDPVPLVDRGDRGRRTRRRAWASAASVRWARSIAAARLGGVSSAAHGQTATPSARSAIPANTRLRRCHATMPVSSAAATSTITRPVTRPLPRPRPCITHASLRVADADEILPRL